MSHHTVETSPEPVRAPTTALRLLRWASWATLVCQAAIIAAAAAAPALSRSISGGELVALGYAAFGAALVAMNVLFLVQVHALCSLGIEVLRPWSPNFRLLGSLGFYRAVWETLAPWPAHRRVYTACFVGQLLVLASIAIAAARWPR
jgi:hypothetical protein